MTACFKLMKALQPKGHQPGNSFCEPCVYCNRNLDPSYPSSEGPARNTCGLDFMPGDDKCNEMRTNNCSARKI